MSTLTNLFLLALFITPGLTSKHLAKRGSCEAGYTKCSPSGAITTTAPDIGVDLSWMYNELVYSIQGVKKRSDLGWELLDSRANVDQPSVCCVDDTDCLLLSRIDMPFCYDKFTTNYYLADGSYGSIITGNYNVTDGSVANLITGNYTLENGDTGNIYSDNVAQMPDTSTMAMPTPWTSSGVGSAIPVTALGAEITYTTTIPGTTIKASTASKQTIPASVVSGSTVIPASTKPASTIPGTTISPITTVVTTTRSAAAMGTNAANSFSSDPILLDLRALIVMAFAIFGI
ncbi:MAG: hypothetical protein M1834_009580 [Cirrosporium novae-zelandiae]|nr:MAG: hypothetical protein M1834_009580 [Cirrosporium novae-zelandiae]